jgi:hypothetical protein
VVIFAKVQGRARLVEIVSSAALVSAAHTLTGTAVFQVVRKLRALRKPFAAISKSRIQSQMISD